MGSTTTQTTIANRGLQLVGYKSIGSINDNDRGAIAMRRAYQPVLESMLRANFWGFSIKRITLTAAVLKPVFGKANYFQLPGDFIMLAPPDQNTAYVNGPTPSGLIPSSRNTGIPYTNWVIESFPDGGRCIAADESGPLYVRYISNDVREADFDSSFVEAFSAALGMETCEELTQSNTKLQNIEKMYDDAMKDAKKRNAFEQMPVQPPVDPWLLVRL